MGDRSGSTPGVVILGAGRHGRNVADVLAAAGRTVAGFLDDTKPIGERVNGIPVVGRFDGWSDPALLRTRAFIVAVGDNRARRAAFSAIAKAGGRLVSAVHPGCVVSPSARIDEGVYLNAFCCVNANAHIGRYSLVEALCFIGADSVLEEGVWLGPGCRLTGGARVGAGTFVGSGSVVVGPAQVGAGSIIGAGATVIRDIPTGVLAVGTPARVKKPLT